MTGNVTVKHEKLFDVKIQVGSQGICMAADACLCLAGSRMLMVEGWSGGVAMLEKLLLVADVVYFMLVLVQLTCCGCRCLRRPPQAFLLNCWQA